MTMGLTHKGTTICDGCGEHWHLLTSPDVNVIDWNSLGYGILGAELVHKACSRRGAPRYVREHSLVSCRGQILLAVVGISDAVVEQVSYGLVKGPSVRDVERHWGNFFVKAPVSTHDDAVLFGELVESLLKTWDDSRNRGIWASRGEVLTKESRKRLKELRGVDSVSDIISQLVMVRQY